MKIIPYYHVSAMSNWRSVADEQLRTLKAGGFDETVMTVFCGSPADERDFMRLADSNSVRTQIVHRERDCRDFEFPTLAVMQNDCLNGSADHVLYFHTKGVSQPDCQHRIHWRWFMNAYMLRGFADLPVLLAGHDYCAPVIAHQPMRHSCGNYFAASASYIRRLPLIGNFRRMYAGWIQDNAVSYYEERHAAEMWIDCLGAGRARQLYPSPDCDIAAEDWWRTHPEVVEFSRTRGS